jgi:arabinose-5-phosphate isomerase
MTQSHGEGVTLAAETATGSRVVSWAREVLDLEGAAILQLKDRIGKEFEAAIQALSEARGQILTLGVGKSGLVAKKIAATLTSTGTPSTFVHPVDAVHGDLGIVSPLFERRSAATSAWWR